MNVLVIGAHGTGGAAITNKLDDQYDFRLLDVEGETRPDKTVTAGVRE